MNQKLEEMLQLALQTPYAIRDKSQDLNVGFDSADNTWELIVKYHDTLENLKPLNIQVEYLIAGYALLLVPEELVEAIAAFEQIEYVEKPKNFYYQQISPVEDSCIMELPGQGFRLSGKGVLIAVLDSGIDYKLSEFRTQDGKTRIRFLWDQTVAGQGELGPPEGFVRGVELSAQQIDEALRADDRKEEFLLSPSIDVTGHGTAVAGIAAGSSQKYRGVAAESELLIVKLGMSGTNTFPRTTDIMRGVTWALRKAQKLGMPMAINLSFGNSYGAHDGSSLFERFLDNAAEIGRTVICVGSGNEGANRGHKAGSLSMGIPTEIELSVGEYEQSFSMQLWKNYSDVYRIRLRSPGGQETEVPVAVELGKYVVRLEETQIQVYLGEPTPYSAVQEIYFNFIPEGGLYINSGVWSVSLEAVSIVTGEYYFYLSASSARSARTGFLRSTPEVTLTIPSTASKVVTVGAYDSIYEAYADFSGRGYADSESTLGVVTTQIAKPDLAAPGVNIAVLDRTGGLTAASGTSFATPIVTGAAALLMEWGIVQENDPFLYGEKVKAYLRRGALPLRGETVYPNSKVGWGKLCVRNSLPR